MLHLRRTGKEPQYPPAPDEPKAWQGQKLEARENPNHRAPEPCPMEPASLMPGTSSGTCDDFSSQKKTPARSGR